MNPEPQRVVVATTNVKKGREMLQILSGGRPDLEFVTLAGFTDMPEVEETGETFAENARLKARAAAQFTHLPAIADDGGLCIDALGGMPGVKSHRYLGVDTSFEVKMEHILAELAAAPDAQRGCRFQCAVCIALPDGREADCMGICEGRVARERRGAYGFGYDPIFFVVELGRHMAELPPEEKHRISHRGKALACALENLAKMLPPPLAHGEQESP